MDIFYTASSRQYKGNEFPEGAYRLEKIPEYGERISLETSPLGLIHSVHPPEYIEQLERACTRNRMIAEVPTDGKTFESVVQSAALAGYAARNQAFGCTRPPGHHAEKQGGKGFCFVNNMAAASSWYLQQEKKVCILDIDGHQGDGTELIFYDDNRVLFLSIHEEFAYPYFYLGREASAGYDVTVDRRGVGAGDGHTWNIPVPRGSGDDILLECLHKFAPAVQEYAPDVIGISAGFDGYTKDALLHLNYSQHGFYRFGRAVREFGIPVFGLLEGGYHQDIPECIQGLIEGLSGMEFTSDQESSQSNTEVRNRFQFYLDRLP